MNRDARDIDRLLKSNLDRQLAGFNYERFADGAARRLAAADLKRRPNRRIVRYLALAAAIIFGLAGLTIVLMHLNSSASVNTIAPGRATVALAGSGIKRALGRCQVQIHAPEKPAQEPKELTRWCIVTLPEPPDDVEPDGDTISLACLF